MFHASCFTFHDFYQLDRFTPGISPRETISRKQILHRSNAPMYPRFLPQRKQRFTFRVENFGVFFDLAMVDVLGM
ncbi:hypothetical protein A3C91_03285 [Candidatus Azambacteria bacterium RIFCSPHIGHO2_02_FULL_52_12]|uniref:Uncharacterized protein n=1 Tax=Candidatus Azambacteria bacterium RIFCSPLOWO2_01_FULL_46_25 TaxID=1797298 RepID=A0A1F5BU53_9BACT|nr:MAG: hypothetical protein A3C91_03285 [Candidatus Azambacteria bacterium RIFCSPHIGHO2_02_FULL_52_12]OGD34130.1 MAG: hypothetical protein A2988_01470 [Candidatus Azambacteria bacterium RIFCSPLOWO2_01_FULL_46_25]OGD36729.1 MAG: hypothetical protein A2850_00425 [Candidatus Azambacteria bacterium RIFCSPHIGHO2_01_FULL_51_74]